jgi:hypothetical protein
MTHAHSHGPGGRHHHHHTLEPSGQGTVMLNIGGGIGALIIHTEGEWLGHEIEVSPAGAPDERTHAAVRARYVLGGVTFCVVLDALPEGQYLLWQDAPEPLAEVDVRSGHVTEFTWPVDAIPGRGLVSV